VSAGNVVVVVVVVVIVVVVVVVVVVAVGGVKVVDEVVVVADVIVVELGKGEVGGVAESSAPGSVVHPASSGTTTSKIAMRCIMTLECACFHRRAVPRR